MYAGGCENQEKTSESGSESHKWANIHHLDNLKSPLQASIPGEQKSFVAERRIIRTSAPFLRPSTPFVSVEALF